MHLLASPAHLPSWNACVHRRETHLLGSGAHLPDWIARGRIKEMRLLGSHEHLPILGDRGCHRPAHLSGVRGAENVRHTRLPDSCAPLSGQVDRLSARDAHLPSSKMHGKARPRTFFEKSMIQALRDPF